MNRDSTLAQPSTATPRADIAARFFRKANPYGWKLIYSDQTLSGLLFRSVFCDVLDGLGTFDPSRN